MRLFKNKNKQPDFRQLLKKIPRWEFKSAGLKRVWRQVGADIWRNKLVSLATLLMIIVMLFASNVVLTLSFVGDELMVDVNKSADINVELIEDIDEFRLQDFIQELQKKPQIKSVDYISKEEALEKFRGFFPDTGLLEFLEKYDEPNPFPESLVLVANDIRDNQAIIDYLNETKYQDLINLNKFHNDILSQNERNQRLVRITNLVQYGGGWLVGIFTLITFLVIYNAIRLMIYTHQREIEIMRLVGAQYSFIRRPFLTEGVIYGGTAVIISLLLLVVLFKYLETVMIAPEVEIFSLDKILFTSVVFFQKNFFWIFSAELLLIFLFGFLSSYWAVRRYLKRSLLNGE